ncbi:MULTISPECIES: hypothetical protein [unclassified Helicobacter]|uniref:hypothetical protein n=1 Tax=unclassified Helicobacter TaxID=2593540 RepID=UPI000CF0D2C9|nr:MULTISPECIES: hypothetical protein [unclassified Helicobacter]
MHFLLKFLSPLKLKDITSKLDHTKGIAYLRKTAKNFCIFLAYYKKNRDFFTPPTSSSFKTALPSLSVESLEAKRLLNLLNLRDLYKNDDFLLRNKINFTSLTKRIVL